MRSKRYLAGIITLLALTGCGKVEVQDTDTEVLKDTEMQETSSDELEEKELINLSPMADKSSGSTGEGSEVISGEDEEEVLVSTDDTEKKTETSTKEQVSENTETAAKTEKEDPTTNITYLDTTPSDDMEDIGEMYFKEITSEDEIIMNIEGLPIVRDQLLVTVKDGVTKTEVEALAAQYEFVIVGAIALTGDYQWESIYELSIEELDEKLNEVSASDQVGYVSYNYTWPMEMEPEPDIL